MQQSIYSIAKKQIFRKDRSNAVAKEKKLAPVKITRHNSSHSGNQTFVSIIIDLHPWLNFYLRDFNAIFLNSGQACDGYIFTRALYYDHAVTSGRVQNFHWLQREFNSMCQSRTVCSESPTVIKNILCFLPFGFLCTTGWFCGGSLLSMSAQNICLEEKISLSYCENHIFLISFISLLNK